MSGYKIEWAAFKTLLALKKIPHQAVDLENAVRVFFQDGSTIIQHSKGTVGATSAGVSSSAKRTGEIIHGTGRFQGIKGTMTTSAKLLLPEKGELGGKSLGEGTMVYTLPSK